MTETTKWTDEQFTRIIKMLSAQAERGSKVVPPALRGEISQWGKQAPWKLSCGYSEDCYLPEFLSYLSSLPRCNYNTTPIQWLRRRDKSLLGWPDLWEVWCDFRRISELKHKESEIAIPSSWQRKAQLAGRSPADYDDSYRRKILLALNWLYKELGIGYSAIGQVTRNSESPWELGWQKHVNFKHWKFTNVTITPDLCSQDKFGLFLVYFPDKGLCITDWDNLPIYCDRLLSWARSLRELKKVSIPSS